MADKTKVGVIGVGYLGYHHARIYSRLPRVELIGVSDVHQDRAEEVASQFDTATFTDRRALTEAADALSVAVPTRAHFEVASELLESGKHVLLEKPMATTLEEADELLRLSEKHRVILQIGHSERFNSALQRLIGMVKRPMFIEAHRLERFNPRGLDVDVVLDLMIHDLDVVLTLVNSELTEIDAVGVPVISAGEDIANARLRFKNGCIVNSTVSRISPDQMRKIRIFERSAYYSLDYVAHEIKAYRMQTETVDPESPMDAISVEVIPVQREEPLRLELESFIDSIRTGKPPVVSAKHGRDALDLALKIVSVIRNRPVP